MTFGESIKTVFSKYATFSGRASRSEYWWFVALNSVVGLVIYLIAAPSGMTIDSIAANGGSSLAIIEAFPGWASALLGCYSLAVLLPSLALSVRRLHDIGKGGGWIFISLVPLIGGIWYLVLMLLPSQLGDNRFGSQPN